MRRMIPRTNAKLAALFVGLLALPSADRIRVAGVLGTVLTGPYWRQLYPQHWPGPFQLRHIMSCLEYLKNEGRWG